MGLENTAFIDSTNKYRYNLPAPKFARQAGLPAPERARQAGGKELNDNFGYHLYAYGARGYDPAIGRFIGIDPASDKFTHVTTYNYAENSPILNIDLWGLQKFSIIARAFIPDKKVENPNLLSKIKFFLGDDRGYDPNATSSRAEQSVQLNFDNSSTSTLSNVASPSIGLDKEGNEIARSGVDAAGNVTSKCRDRQGYRGFTKTRDNPGHHSG